MHSIQKQYITAKNAKQAAWDKARESGKDADYKEADRLMTIQIEYEKALIDWALKEVGQLSQYKAYAGLIEYAVKQSAHMPAYRQRLIDICLQLEV